LSDYWQIDESHLMWVLGCSGIAHQYAGFIASRYQQSIGMPYVTVCINS